MTRGINFTQDDFDAKYLPQNLIVETLPSGIGRFDVRTNFKILRGKQDILEYFNYCHKNGVRLANWIDVESISMMQQLTPNEIAEILYLFHANQTLRSAFFYKLQNNYVYLTLPNGLLKVYYRYISHFYPRFNRVAKEKMETIVNEGKSRFFGKKKIVSEMPQAVIEQLSPLFSRGLKLDFTQIMLDNGVWVVPLFIIEDELTLLSANQALTEQVGQLVYHSQTDHWQVNVASYI